MPRWSRRECSTRCAADEVLAGSALAPRHTAPFMVSPHTLLPVPRYLIHTLALHHPDADNLKTLLPKELHDTLMPRELGCDTSARMAQERR